MRLRILLATSLGFWTASVSRAQDAAQRCAVSDNVQAQVTACRDALRDDSLDAYSHYNLGMAYYQLRQLDSALAHWRISAAIRPDYASSHAMMASLDVDRHQNVEAMAEADSAIHVDGKNAMGYKAKALVLISEQRGADAIPLARQATTLVPNDPWAHSILARAFGETRQFAEALAETRQAITLNGPPGRMYALLGNVLLALKHPDHALTAADTAIAADSTLLDGYMVRVNALQALHRTQEADAARAQLLQRFPEAGAVASGFALSVHASHANALDVATVLATLDSGDNLVVRQSRVNALFRAGEKKNAVLAMRDFVRRHADDAHGWSYLGYIEAMSLHYSNALADWKKAVALDTAVLSDNPSYQHMRTELAKIVAEPKAATVTDLDLPIPPDPRVHPPPKHRVVHGTVTVGPHLSLPPAPTTK